MILRSAVYEAECLALKSIVERLDRAYARLMHPLRRFALELEDRRLYQQDREAGLPDWVRHGDVW